MFKVLVFINNFFNYHITHLVNLHTLHFTVFFYVHANNLVIHVHFHFTNYTDVDYYLNVQIRNYMAEHHTNQYADLNTVTVLQCHNNWYVNFLNLVHNFVFNRQQHYHVIKVT